MIVLALILSVLTVARLARLVAEDEVSLGLRRWVIRRYGPEAFITKMVHCAPWCLSMWFAMIMPVAVLWPTVWLMAILSIPAGSMVAAMILTYTDRK